MALEIKETFTIDAAKLLAKLHRGACETHKDMKFFNSGVVDDENIAPDACEKSKISFDTAAKKYELGVVAEEEIQCKLKHTADDILEKMTEPGKEEGKKEEGKKEEGGDEKSGEDAKINEKPVNESVIPSFMQFIMEDDKPDGGKDGEKKPGDVYVDPFNEPQGASEEVKKMVKENRDALEKVVQVAVKNSVQYLKDYMTVFAGDDEAKKIDDKAVARVYLPDGSEPAKFEYKDGVIEGIGEDERKREWAEVLKKKPDTDVYVLKNLCCKMAYSLNMES